MSLFARLLSARPRAALPYLGLLLLFLILAAPDSLLWVGFSTFLVLPLELSLVGLVLLVPGTGGRMLRWLAAVLLAARAVFVLADTISHQTFARPFNPVFDAYLLADAMNLLSGVLGPLAAVAIALLAIVALALIVGCAFWLLQKVREPLQRMQKPRAALVVAVLYGTTCLVMRAADLPYVSQRFYQHIAQHTRNAHSSLVDMRDFRDLLTRQAGTPTGLSMGSQTDTAEPVGFEKLRGRDLLVIFIESYGRSLLDKPEYAEYFRPFLAQEENKLKASGVAVRSAYLTSPTVGGLSWFAHATAMSGLWIDSQVRYDSLVMSRHVSLNRLFRNAGWRTVAVMPAITMAWPEAEYFGYDQIYHAHNSGYAGKPFNWITMPDQYTLAAFHRRELAPGARKPVMAEIALISSHAPWTPVPTLVDWHNIGDGRIFDEQAAVGATPEEVWRDPARIRLQYRLAVEYSLRVLFDYLVRHADDNLLVIALGDHQPAPLVMGTTDNRDVPVHFFSRDPALLNALAYDQLHEGLQPVAHGPVRKMNELRQHLIDAFWQIPLSLAP